MNFEDFLHRKFMEAEPQVLDDDLPEAYDHWVSDLGYDDWIRLAELWGAELSKEVRALVESEK